LYKIHCVFGTLIWGLADEAYPGILFILDSSFMSMRSIGIDRGTGVFAL
jgi:hypothetical protein